MFYGVIVDPSKKDPVAYVPSPDGDMLLHISTCCLDPQKAKKNSGVKATLMVKSGGEEQAFAVCALREGGTESIAVDLAMEEYAEFSVVGNCPIHLTGYYMPLDEDDEDEEGLIPGYGDDGDSDDFDMDFDDDPALLGYDASGLPIYDGEGATDDDDDDDDVDDGESDSDSEDESDHSDGPGGGNVIEIKDITNGANDDDSSDSEEDGDSEDDSEDDSGESEEEEPAPAPAQKKQKPEPKTQPKTAAVAAKKEEPVSETKTKAKKYPNGFEIHELKQGKASGKVAKAGKRVTMKYIGRLQKNGQVFDQTKGNATFKFRLGVGEVIKGWDRGVEGMRVGDRRKLVCPPSMAYGSSRTGPIPANSTLVFEVELIDVR